LDFAFALKTQAIGNLCGKEAGSRAGIEYDGDGGLAIHDELRRRMCAGEIQGDELGRERRCCRYAQWPKAGAGDEEDSDPAVRSHVDNSSAT
jgi:hypothetical protein